MTGPSVVQLKQAGDSLMFAVTRCEVAKTGNYPEVEIEGVDGDRAVLVKMPRQSADRQLTRLDTTYAGIVGKIVTISRDPNKQDASKPYWGLTINGDAPTNGKPAAPPAQAPQAEPSTDDRTVKLKAVFALQEVCFTHALKLAGAAEKAGITPTFEGVSALTAQAMIEASRRGA